MPPVISSRGRIWAAALTRAAASAAEMVNACRSSAAVEEQDRSPAMPRCFDFAGVVDLRGVHGSGQHFQAATEFQLLVGQQFPERAVPNVPDRGERRFDERERLVAIGESGAGP